jgi:hypothetical protein
VPRLVNLVLTGLAALVAACATASAGDSAPVVKAEMAAPTLANTFASPDEAVGALLEALARKDTAALRELAVTKFEFHDFVWPGLDAARPERRLPWDFVWQQHAMRHEHGLQQIVARYGGQALEFRGLELTGPVTEHVTPHGTYRIHRSSVVELATPDGRIVTARLFGSLISSGERYKIYSFITD